MIQITCNGAKRAQNPPNGEESFKIQSKSGKRTKVLSKHTSERLVQSFHHEFSHSWIEKSESHFSGTQNQQICRIFVVK